MNLALVDPFILAQDCPEALVGRLGECGKQSILFNLLLIGKKVVMLHASSLAIVVTTLRLEGYVVAIKILQRKLRNV